MSSMVMLTLDHGCDGSVDYLFVEPVDILVGRGNDCDLKLPNTASFRHISDHHCLLRINPPRIWMKDLESRNGTFVNDLKISSMVGPFRIYDEDVLQLGPIRMTVHIHEKLTANNNVELGKVCPWDGRS